MKLKDYIKQGFAGALTLGGSASFIAQTLGEGGGGDPVGIIIGGLFPLIGGALAFRKVRKDYVERLQFEEEQQLLHLFAAHGRRLTIAQIAVMVKKPMSRIEDRMAELQQRGALEIKVSQSGAVVYEIAQVNEAHEEFDDNFLLTDL